MARAFDPFAGVDRWFTDFGRSPTSAAMPMDLYRSGDHFVMCLDLPGVDPGSIDVNVEDRTLTVRANRTAPTGDDTQWLVRERTTGAYARQMTLGRGLALDKVDASYADGVLTLTIPVAEDAKPRRIEVQHGRQENATAPAVTA